MAYPSHATEKKKTHNKPKKAELGKLAFPIHQRQQHKLADFLTKCLV